MGSQKHCYVQETLMICQFLVYKPIEKSIKLNSL